jgi:hypothetical protein
MKKLFAILAIAVMCTSAFAAPKSVSSNNGHDGVWWQSKSGLYKEAFIGGYKSGQASLQGGKSQFYDYSAGQLVDGLDHFYRDFKNTNIHIDEGLLYVKDELEGKSDADLATELQNMRKAAAAAKAAVKETE